MSQDTMYGRDNWMESPFGEWESEPAGESYETEAVQVHFSAEDFAPGGVAGLEVPYRETADGRLEALSAEDLAPSARTAARPPASGVGLPPGAFRVCVTSGSLGLLAAEPEPGAPQGTKGFTGYAFAFQVASTRDSATGMATGRRAYGPVVVRKRVGPSSPQLFKAMVENHMIEVVIEFFRPANSKGERPLYYRITLRDAVIATLRHFTAPPPMGDAEEVSITFRTIRMQHLEGGIEYEDTLVASG